MDNKIVGLRIKALRTGKGLSQQELAKELNIDRNKLSKIETGENSPTAGILLGLKRFFSISIDWLLTGEDPEPLESDDQDLHELLAAVQKNRICKHAILSYFYMYKAENPMIFKEPGEPDNIIDIGFQGVENDRSGR